MNNPALQEFLLDASADNTFALAEAQAYKVIQKKLIHRDSMNAYLQSAGIYRAIQLVAETDGHLAQDAFLAFLDSEEYNFMQGVGLGDNQLAALDQMIAANITQVVGGNTVNISAGLAALKPVIMARANVETYPFENVTLEEVVFNRQELLNLTQNNAQHIINFSIANSASDLTSVIVEQRFGADNTDLTEWHACASTRVHYRQQGYKIQVGASPAAYRELRMVSSVQLGLSIA